MLNEINLYNGCDENGYCGGMIEPIDEFREQELIDELEEEENKKYN